MDVFGNVLKIVFRGRRNTFATFSEDALHFSWQAQHFGRVRVNFSWQAQHFRRVVLRFFANRIGTAARSGNHVQIPWQAWHFLTRVKIGGSLARNARFEVCPCVLACLWMRSNYGGSCSALRLRMCQRVKIGGSLARNARFDACMCVVLTF